METSVQAVAGNPLKFPGSAAEIVGRVFGWVRRAGRKLGPYLVLELLMPGGTMLALLLFLYRRRVSTSVWRAS